MKAFRTLLLCAALLGVAALAIPFAAGAAGNTVVDDTFSDGTSTTQNLAANSLAVYKARSATVRTDAAGSVNFNMTATGTSGEAFWAYFTSQGSPVTLAVGDKITFSGTFSLTDVAAVGSDMRFGLFYSGATRQTADLSSGQNNAAFGDDPGYGAQFYGSGTGSAFNLYRRDPSPTYNNIFNSMGVTDNNVTTGWTPLSGSGVPARQPLANATPYTFTYSVERLKANETRVTVSVSGGALSNLSYSAVESSQSPNTRFDWFSMRFAGVNFAKQIKFTRFLVEYQPGLPVITSQPQPTNLVVQVGSSVTMSVAATGSSLSYQWQRDGAAIPANVNPSAATPTLNLSDVQTGDAGSYTAVVTNGSGSTASNPVTLGVSTEPVPPPPSVTAQPANTTAVVGSPASLAVTATGSNLFYQWFRNGTLIPGATGPALNFAAAQTSDAAEYTVVVSNPSGSVTSAPAALSVVSPMKATGFSPDNGAGELNIDVPLKVTFDKAPLAGTTGKIRVFTEDGALYDTVDLGVDTNTTANAPGPQSARPIGGSSWQFNYHPVIVEGNTATVYTSRKLAYGQTYYVTLDQGVFVDAAGAPFAGMGDANVWRFTTKAAGPAAGATSLVVAADGTGDFNTVQAAVDFVPANGTKRTVINVRRGTYTEIVYVASNKRLVTVRGEDRDGSVVQYPNNETLNAGSGPRAAFGVDAADFTLENITVRNTTTKFNADGRTTRQAEAFRGNNDRIVLNRVNLSSFQDTLLLQTQTGQGAFVADSYIEGDVDFAWGTGTVFFQNTELKMLTSGGYFTQVRNGQGKNGYVFVNCKLTGGQGVTGAYLTRVDPNAFPSSQVVFINTRMQPGVVTPAGWLINNATAAPGVQFWEYNSTDLSTGAQLNVSQRAAFSRQMTAAEAVQWSDPAFVLGWAPQTKLTAAVNLGNLSQSYTGAPAAASVTTDPAGLDVSVTYNGSTTPPTALGSYNVVAAVQDAAYQGTATGTLVVNPVSASVTLGNLYQTADGGPKAVTVSTSPAGAPVSVTYNGSPAPPSAPGKYAVLATTADPGFTGGASATLTLYAPGQQPLRAFPGAEGSGELTAGGRGGDVYHVTNLNDSGPGSLREGIRTAAGPRTIVFDVSGTIRLRSRLSINKPFLTIAGQTAPGDGITVADWNAIVTDTHDVIIRYVRFRVGDAMCPNYQDDAFGVDRSTNVIVDHVSASWSVDETLSVTESDKVTVQWSFITESMKNSCHEKGTHGYGSLIRYGSGLVTYHHNLYAHHYSRNPRVGDNIGLDFVNNVVYDWGIKAGYSADAAEGTPRVNYVGNYFVAGPSTPASNRTRAFEGGSTGTKIHQSNNLVDANVNGARDGSDLGWSMVVGSFTKQEPGRFDFSQVDTDDPAKAYERVLRLAGHSLARDAVDARVAGDVEHDTGTQINTPGQVGGYPALNSAPAPADSDRDGMPDAWETEHGLNPADAADGRAVAAGGYTNLENYLNGLVPVPGSDRFGDATAPATSLAPSQSPNQAGWNNQDVTLSLSAADDAAGAGVREIVYAVDGQVRRAHGAFAPVNVTKEGTTVVTFYAVDNAGNAEPAQTYTVRLDKTAPAVGGVTRTAANANGWNKGDVTVGYSATDAGSGFDSGATAEGSATVSTEGAGQTFNVEVSDLAGNTASVTVGDINIDKTAPVIEAARVTAPNPAGWNRTDVLAGYTASDDGSGLAADTPAQGAYTFKDEGAGQSHTFRVEDLAGNAASATVEGVNIDKTAPAVNVGKPSEGAFYAVGAQALAAFACADNLSGNATCEGTVAAATPLDTATPGPKTFKVSTTDEAGNAASKEVSYTVGYALARLYDTEQAHRAGSTVPVKLQLLDDAGANLSSAGVAVRALGVSLVSAESYGPLADAGNANPDQGFRFDPTLGETGGYIFNLKTNGLAPGTYRLHFNVGTDPYVYTTQFQVR